jgi:hypothetical protein
MARVAALIGAGAVAEVAEYLVSADVIAVCSSRIFPSSFSFAYRVQGLRFRAQGFGSRSRGLGYRVKGFELISV